MLTHRPLRGAIFESFAALELIKSFAAKRREAAPSFWRDATDTLAWCEMDPGGSPPGSTTQVAGLCCRFYPQGESAMALITDSELRMLLLDSKFEEFNALAGDEPPDLENFDLRGINLQGADLSHANLRGAYLRNADLRGLDLRHADLDGASLHGARISGVRFPDELDAAEIRLALDQGTRLRVRLRFSD